MLSKSGIPTKQQIQSVFPKQKDLLQMKAIIECYEEIPCNPCETYCPFDAIEIGPQMNHRPQLIVDRCIGCSICVSVCPGVAIMLASVDDDVAKFTIAYELLPLPEVNWIWHGVNRAGEVIGDVTITKVVKNKDHSALITLETMRDYLYDLVTIRRKVDG